MRNLKNLLGAHFRGEIKNDEDTLKKYSRDASILEIRPEAVLFPRDEADVRAAVRFVREHKSEDKNLALTARAAGTCMSGGAINDSLILDVTAHMNTLISLDKETTTVLPGLYYRDLESKTKEKGVVLPCFTASKDICALGGMIGNNAGGEKTLRYGKMDRYVKKLTAVFSDGNAYTLAPLSKNELDAKMKEQTFEGEAYRKLYALIHENKEEIERARPRVSKNSAGYALWDVWDGKTFDLTKLFVGSQGTLGIVTEAELALVPIKKHTKLVTVFLKDLSNLAEIVNTILPFEPESFESYDEYTMKIALKFFPDIVHSMKMRNVLRLFISFLPEVGMVLRGGIPKLILLIECAEDTQALANEKADKIQQALDRFGVVTRIVPTETEAEKYWTIRRESFNLLRKHMKGKRAAPFIDDVIVEPKHLPEFLPKLEKILNSNNLLYTIAGHVGNGNFHIIPLLDMHNPESKKTILRVSEEVYDLVVSYGGSITGEHNDGLIRTIYLNKMFSPKMIELFRETKNIFDPDLIFNPEKKVGGTKDYLSSHIIRE